MPNLQYRQTFEGLRVRPWDESRRRELYAGLPGELAINRDITHQPGVGVPRISRTDLLSARRSYNARASLSACSREHTVPDPEMTEGDMPLYTGCVLFISFDKSLVDSQRLARILLQSQTVMNFRID
jgi:hypothetical protein